jgi:hypothetical protein
MLSSEPLRISLNALREEISSIDDFYLSDSEIATATALVQENAIRYGPWTKLYEGLDDLSQGDDGEDLSTDSDNGSSTRGFVDVDLTTPENGPLHFRSRGLKDEEQLTPYLADLRI